MGIVSFLQKKTDQIGDTFSVVNPIDPVNAKERQLNENLARLGSRPLFSS